MAQAAPGSRRCSLLCLWLNQRQMTRAGATAPCVYAAASLSALCHVLPVAGCRGTAARHQRLAERAGGEPATAETRRGSHPGRRWPACQLLLACPGKLSCTMGPLGCSWPGVCALYPVAAALPSTPRSCCSVTGMGGRCSASPGTTAFRRRCSRCCCRCAARQACLQLWGCTAGGSALCARPVL